MLNDRIEIRADGVQEVSFQDREISVLAIPYNSETDRVGDFHEVILPGAFDGIQDRSKHVTVNREHDYSQAVGKVVGYDTTDKRGLVATMRISKTARGDETLALAADGVLKSSVGMIIRRGDWSVKDKLRSVRRVHMLDHISLVSSPAYLDADVLAVREAQEDESPISTPNLDEVIALIYGG